MVMGRYSFDQVSYNDLYFSVYKSVPMEWLEWVLDGIGSGLSDESMISSLLRSNVCESAATTAVNNMRKCGSVYLADCLSKYSGTYIYNINADY